MKSGLFKWFFGAFQLLILPHLAAATVFTVSSDKADGIYQAGETATLTISAVRKNKPAAGLEISCVFRGDDAAPAPCKLTLDADGKAKITASLDHPGQLVCQIYTASGKSKAAKDSKSGALKVYGVMFSPDKLLPIRPMPKDFNEFWDKEKAAMQKLPLDAELKPVKAKEGFKAFSVCLKAPEGDLAYGYLTMPKDAKPGSLPICLKVYGAGTFSVGPIFRPGVIIFSVNPHNLPNGKSKAFYAKAKKELKTLVNGRRYVFYGETDRNKNYFLGMFRRDYRAMQFLTSLPEWNGKDFIVVGNSQGGGQTLACAGLEPRITKIFSRVPSYCDLGGWSGGRESGGPYRSRSMFSKDGEKILTETAYLDTANFARNIKNPKCVLVTGFSDLTCIASSVYCAFNVIPAKDKKIITDPAASHGNKWPDEAYYLGL